MTPWRTRPTPSSVPNRFDAERELEASGLPQTARDIAFALCRRMDAGTTIIQPRRSPSLNQLARAVGCSRRTIMRHLHTLEAAGWITRTRPPIDRARADHVTTSYTVTIPGPAAKPDGPPLNELAVIITELEKRTGKRVTQDWAARIHRELLDRPGIRRPGAWLRRVIQADADPSRWLPTSQPPSITELHQQIARLAQEKDI
jgi:DNA-binding Lrp family transcriptional regulator